MKSQDTTDSTIAPQKPAIFFNERFMAARHKDAMKNYPQTFSCLQRTSRRTIERSRRGGKGRRISGDTAWIWFQNRRFRYRTVGGATVERLIRMKLL